MHVDGWRHAAAICAFVLAVTPNVADAQSKRERRVVDPPAVERLPRFVENRPPVLAPSKVRRPARSVLRGKAAAAGSGTAAAPVGAQSVSAAPSVAPMTAEAKSETSGADGAPMTMAMFLDRLMMAESGGRIDARNPRSTALGPYQFIESTFLAVAKRHFSAETEKLTPQQILALRTDAVFSRRAAEAYTMDNAAVLKASDIEPTYPNLRLAFLLGVAGAIKVLKAPPEMPLRAVLAPAVLLANPFMVTMTARSLALRSAREVNQPITTRQAVDVPAGTSLPRRVTAPSVVVRCNIVLPSCKRWVALQQAKLRVIASVKVPRRSLASAAGVAAGGETRQGNAKANPRR
jgi:hypothetical protein